MRVSQTRFWCCNETVRMSAEERVKVVLVDEEVVTERPKRDLRRDSDFWVCLVECTMCALVESLIVSGRLEKTRVVRSTGGGGSSKELEAESQRVVQEE